MPLIVLTLLSFTPSIAHGESNPYILLDSDRGVSALISDVNSFTKQFDGLKQLRTASGNSEKVFINKTAYIKLKTEEKKNVMAGTLDYIKESNLGGRDRSRLYNFVEEQDEGTAMVVRQLSTDVSTDLATANSILRPFTGPFSTFLGVACIIIFISLTLAVTIDLLFLTIPMFQAFVMRNDNVRPKYISQEAWDALLVVESNLGNGQASSLWGIYLKSRMKSMFIVGLTLAYLIGGEVFDLAMWIVDFFRTITEG